MDDMATPSARSSRGTVDVVGREAAGVSAAFRLEHLCLFCGRVAAVDSDAGSSPAATVLLPEESSSEASPASSLKLCSGGSRGRPVELHRGVVHTFDFLTRCEKTWRYSSFWQLSFGLSVVHNHVFERSALLLPELRDLQILRSIDLRPLRIIEALGVLSEQDV